MDDLACFGPLYSASVLPAVPQYLPFSFEPVGDSCEDASWFLQLTQDEDHPNARCLDGSSGSFYVNKVNNAKGTLVILGNNGLCVTEEECAQRAFNSCGQECTGTTCETTYGGSANLPLFLNMEDYQSSVIFGDSEEVNPLYYNYNKVFVNDCDGGGFASERGEVPLAGDYAEASIFMNGKQIGEAVFDRLVDEGLLLGGGDFVIASQGYASIGLTAWMSEALSVEGVQSKNLVYSGYFPEYSGDYSSRMNPYSHAEFSGTYEEFWNTAAETHGYPVSYPEVLTSHLLATTETPTLVMGSKFDPWQLSSAFGMDYSRGSAVNEWAANYDDTLASMSAANSNVKVATSSCQIHNAQNIVLATEAGECPAGEDFSAWYETFSPFQNPNYDSVDFAMEAQVKGGSITFTDAMRLFQLNVWPSGYSMVDQAGYGYSRCQFD